MFFEEDSLFKLAYPVDILLKQLQIHVMQLYDTFKKYNMGAAFELLVAAQLRSEDADKCSEMFRGVSLSSI